MAIFQNIFGFFLPNQRRSRAAGGGGAPTDAATERIISGVDKVIEPFNAPDYVTEYLTDDLKSAFDVKGKARPGYEPGRVPPARFNLVDFVTDPLETTWKTVKTPFETKFEQLVYTPDDFLSQLDEAVWNHLYTTEWKGVVPYSTQQVVARWNESKNNPVKIVRNLATRAVRENPGIIFMKARALASLGVPLKADIAAAEGYENLLSEALQKAEDASKKGEYEKADRYWRTADNLQRRFKREGKEISKETDREFRRLSRKGGPLYNTSEARFIRYWESRNLHYATLGFLRTYRKDGFWGVVKVYGWGYVKDKIKDFYYATQLNTLVNNIAGKLGVTKLLGKLGGVQTYLKRLRAGFWLKKGLKKVGTWLIEKLGLGELIGSIIGTAGGGPLGTAVGAVIGAIVQFAAEVVVEKLGGVMKIVGFVLAGVVGFFALFGIAIITLLSVILGNHPYPWEAAATEVDCNTAATATSSCVASKEQVEDLAVRWIGGPGNNVEACYNDVIAKAQAAGVDPRVVMAIWVHESNASNYDLYASLGEPPQDFGIPSQAGNGFTVQINSFINFYKNSRTAYASCYAGKSDAEGLFRAFCTAGRAEFGVGSCPNITSAGQACVNSYFVAYNAINAGGSCN